MRIGRRRSSGSVGANLELSVDALWGAAFPESKWFDQSGAAWMGSALRGDQKRKFTTEGTEDTEVGAGTSFQDSSGSRCPLWCASGDNILERESGDGRCAAEMAPTERRAQRSRPTSRKERGGTGEGSASGGAFETLASFATASAGSCYGAQCCCFSRARRSTRRILPLAFFGSSATNSISRGYLNGAIARLQCCWSSSVSSSPGL